MNERGKRADFHVNRCEIGLASYAYSIAVCLVALNMTMKVCTSTKGTNILNDEKHRGRCNESESDVDLGKYNTISQSASRLTGLLTINTFECHFKHLSLLQAQRSYRASL